MDIPVEHTSDARALMHRFAQVADEIANLAHHVDETGSFPPNIVAEVERLSDAAVAIRTELQSLCMSAKADEH